MTEEQIEDSEIIVSYLTEETDKLVRYLLNGVDDQEQKEFILMKMNEQFRFKL